MKPETLGFRAAGYEASLVFYLFVLRLMSELDVSSYTSFSEQQTFLFGTQMQEDKIKKNFLSRILICIACVCLQMDANKAFSPELFSLQVGNCMEITKLSGSKNFLLGNF